MAKNKTNKEFESMQVIVEALEALEEHLALKNQDNSRLERAVFKLNSLLYDDKAFQE